MYDVALLIERQLSDLDADQVVALHEGLDDSVTYHLLLPVDTALWVATGATIASLFVIGYVKAGATGRSRWQGAMEMIVVASFAAIIGYAIGKAVGVFLGINVVA